MALDALPDDAIERYMKSHPLPPDVLYIIDQMMEEDLIDSGTYAALNMYVDRAKLDAVLDGGAFHRQQEPRALAIEMIESESNPRPALPIDAMRHFGRVCIARKKATAHAVIQLADQSLAALPRSIQGAIAYESLCWLRKTIKALGRVEAEWAYEDATVGGAIEPYRDVVRLDGWGSAFKRDIRRLRSRSFIARYVKRCDSADHLVRMASALLDRAERVPNGYVVNTLQDHTAVLEQRRAVARQDALRRFFDAYESEKEARKPIRPPERKRAIRYRRQIIKRALKTAGAIVGDRAVSAFVRGEWVRFDGCRFDLMVRCAFSVARLGHGSLDVRVVESDDPIAETESRDMRVRIGDDGVKPLADLCVFIKDTPALDQLTGFGLLMAAGKEDELIRTANIIRSYPAGETHPSFAERARQKRLTDRTADPGNWTTITPYTRRRMRSGRHWYDRTEQRKKQEVYALETESIWIERLTLAVCGRRGKLLSMAA